VETAGDLARDQGDAALARELWEAAWQEDPSRWGAALSLARAEAGRNPLEAARILLRTLGASLAAFRIQYGITATVGLWLTGCLLWLLFVWSLVWAARALPFLHHAAWETLRGRWPDPWAKALAFVPFLLPFVANVGLLPALGLLAASGSFLLGFPSRRAMVAWLVALLLFPLTLPLTQRLLGPMDPRHPVALLQRAQEFPRDPTLEPTLAKGLQREPGQPLLRFARSWVRWAQGDLAGAREDMEFLASRGGISRAKVLVDLAAIELAMGAEEEAALHLREARRLAPRMASIAYNLALVHLRRLEMERAAEALQRAQDLDPGRFRKISRRSLAAAEAPVMREALGSWDLWPALLRHGPSARGIPLPSWLAFLLPGSNAWMLFPVVPLLGLVLWFLASRLRGLRIRPCPACGGVVCRRCARRKGFRSLCARCASRLQPQTRALAGEGAPQAGDFLLAFLLPGSPQLLGPHPGRGLVLAAASFLLLWSLEWGGLPLLRLGHGALRTGPLPGLPAVLGWGLYLVLGGISALGAHRQARRLRSLSSWIGRRWGEAA
jgi:tetratricopeptide (TPR) repeat protein